MEYWEVKYYKKLKSDWLSGQIRNLSGREAIKYAELLGDLFDTKMIVVQTRKEIIK
jgi:hypothetical protein